MMYQRIAERPSGNKEEEVSDTRNVLQVAFSGQLGNVLQVGKHGQKVIKQAEESSREERQGKLLLTMRRGAFSTSSLEFFLVFPLLDIMKKR